MSNKKKRDKTTWQQRHSRGLASLLSDNVSGTFQGIDFTANKKARKFVAYLLRKEQSR